MHKYFSGITLITLGTLAFLQTLGLYNFGLEFWPAVVTYIGLEMIYGSLFDGRRPSVIGAAIGLVVGGWGLTKILANLGLWAGAYSMGEWFALTWPFLLVMLGLSLLFGRRHIHCSWD